MILIADSGSTKTHWKYINGDLIGEVITNGVNPFYIGKEQIVAMLQNELAPKLPVHDITQVHFYGSGVSQHDKIALVTDSLREVFATAELHVGHDLLAAARGACGTEPGIVCIMGTGSNSCLFDGHDITDNVPSLGFFLGDEGSGAVLGRALLAAYYYRELPDDLKALLEESFNMDKAHILNTVYGAERPNQEVARYARFYHEHMHHPYLQGMMRGLFKDFFQKNVLKYEGHQQLPIHFVGSIAFVHQQLIKSILEEMGLRPGNFFKEPMQGLIAYHTAKL